MCLRCSAPSNRYIIQDHHTGFFVCEECGFSVKNMTPSAYKSGCYIWEINPAWPRFSSFEALILRITEGEKFSLPRCSIVQNIPSRLLSYAFEVLDTQLPPSDKYRLH